VSSAVITGIKSKGDIKVKNEESRDIWCEAPKSKTRSECDILEELWGNWPTKEKADNIYECNERNFWNCSVKILVSVIEPNETIVAI
jgi:hypothetical protein